MNMPVQNNPPLTQAQGLSGRQSFIAWLPVILFMLTAAYIRLRLTWPANYLLLGGDGPYYPLQVKSILEHGRLALPDMPLLFIFEAIVAWILQCFSIGTQSDCIIMAVKLSDAFLPPLAAIPVFLIAKELNKGTGVKAVVANYIIVGFSVLNNNTVLAFSNGLQKNAVGVIWVFFYLYFVIRIFSYSQKRDYYAAFFIAFLCALTHFGCFAIILFLSMAIGIYWLLYRQWNAVTYRKAVVVAAILPVLLCITAVFDLNRFHRLISIPLRIFEYPVFLLVLNGDDVSSFINPLNLFLFIPLLILAVIIIVVKRKTLASSYKVLAWSLVTVAFVLASPFIGLEWANRFYMMSYLPVVVLYLVLLNQLRLKYTRVLPLGIFTLVIFLSVFNFQPATEAITSEAYQDFRRIGRKITFGKNDLVTGRQDLRLLASYEYGTQSAADYLITKADFTTYDHIYVLRQIKGSNFSPNRFRGDAEIPGNAIKVYQAEYFELYRLNNGYGWVSGNGKPPKARGVVSGIHKNYIEVKNSRGNGIKTIEISEGTRLHLLSSTALHEGMMVEISGNFIPFSLNIAAGEINEITPQQ